MRPENPVNTGSRSGIIRANIGDLEGSAPYAERVQENRRGECLTSVEPEDHEGLRGNERTGTQGGSEGEEGRTGADHPYGAGPTDYSMRDGPDRSNTAIGTETSNRAHARIGNSSRATSNRGDVPQQTNRVSGATTL